MRKENIIYVGIDLHKETLTAVMLNCWNQRQGEITIENKPAEFHKLTKKVSRFVTEEKTPGELAGELRPVSHNNCSTKKAGNILELVRTDGETLRDCQESRDIITRSLVRYLQNYREQMLEVEAVIKELLPYFRCTLMTMPDIDIVTATDILSEIGNIVRFPNAGKLAKFARIAPVNFSSSGKGKDVCPKQGNRRLQAIFYFLEIQIVQVSPRRTPRHPVFRKYFQRKQDGGKNKQQALICIARYLVNIVYGMLKNHTEYREPESGTEEVTV